MTHQFPMPISEDIWDLKYRFKDHHTGVIHDQTVEDTWWRVANALAEPEMYQELWANTFYSAMEDWKFMPAGRIIAGAGTDRLVTLFNCYVMGTIPDDLKAIFDSLKEAALTMQQGGGIGYDFSTLRPKGAPVKRVGADASGPLPFMDTWDAMCRTIMSAGTRRGAMMATLRCDHPDIEEFITAKQDPSRLRMFNVSVLCTDAFMEAVRGDKPWDLLFGGKVYRTISALELWNKIMRSTYDYAEPGVIFIDRINDSNNLRYCEEIAATNPCVSGDTPILTDQGWVQIQDTVDQKINIWNGFEFSEVIPRVTGHNQDMWTIYLSDGSELRCTGAHKFILNDGSRVEAQHLQVNQSLEKSNWPIIDGNDNLLIDYYAQGFFAGDGWTKVSTGSQYIGLYGKKKNINHNWNEISRNTYDITGGYTNTDLSQTREYLCFKKNTFKNKDFVPMNASINNKREWLAGLADSDGTITKDGVIQISSKNQNFLLNVKALLNTMGVNGNLKPMKSCYRISISASHVYILNIPTKRLVQVVPSRNASRFIRVTKIKYSGKENIVYCFTEPKRHSGVFNGVYTAQCGEQPLPPYGACLLGSVNLAKFVIDPFTENARIDSEELDKVVTAAIRMMDNVNDVSKFPLEAQRAEAQNKRRIGLGVTGLADMLVMLRVVYGSEEAKEKTSAILSDIAHAAYETSVDLAREKGAFRRFNADEFVAEGTFASGMGRELVDKMKTYGIRNSHLLSIAPTGTISMYGGNVSSGIEPIFAFEYERKVTRRDGTKTTEEVMDYAVAAYRQKWLEDNNPANPQHEEFDPEVHLPDYFVSAQDLSPSAHVEMQAVCQQWVDSSISKTINLPEDIDFADFEKVYMDAYDSGCKGCTTYRPNDVTGSVISVKKDKPEPVTEAELAQRPDVLDGLTYKVKMGGEPAFYITITDVIEDEKRRPLEVFINTKNPEHIAWSTALTRMISAIFRRPHDSSFVVEELKNIFDPKGGGFWKGSYRPSVVAAIGQVIEDHMKTIGYLEPGEAIAEALEPESETVAQDGPVCPNCFSTNFKHESGCTSCGDCGYSSCG